MEASKFVKFAKPLPPSDKSTSANPNSKSKSFSHCAFASNDTSLKPGINWSPFLSPPPCDSVCSTPSSTLSSSMPSSYWIGATDLYWNALSFKSTSTGNRFWCSCNRSIKSWLNVANPLMKRFNWQVKSRACLLKFETEMKLNGRNDSIPISCYLSSNSIFSSTSLRKPANFARASWRHRNIKRYS